jgi:hypothetical protein
MGRERGMDKCVGDKGSGDRKISQIFQDGWSSGIDLYEVLPEKKIRKCQLFMILNIRDIT